MDVESLYEQDPPAPGSSAPASAEPRAELFYATVEDFVTDLLAQQYRRPVDPSGRGTEWQWCASWWRHREAVSRLTALWRAWEALRLNPTVGMALWWRDYADPTMAVLFSPSGPFYGCTPRLHQPGSDPLPVLPAPPGLFSQY